VVRPVSVSVGELAVSVAVGTLVSMAIGVVSAGDAAVVGCLGGVVAGDFALGQPQRAMAPIAAKPTRQLQPAACVMIALAWWVGILRETTLVTGVFSVFDIFGGCFVWSGLRMEGTA